ncbi:MAG: sulfotransferase [Myxococcota bacterium]
MTRTSTVLDKPHRSPAMRVVNGVGQRLPWLKRAAFPLEAQALIARAERQAGVRGSEFRLPPEHYAEGLSRLLASLREEAELTATGQALAHTMVVESLATRMRLEHLWSRTPQRPEPIRAPLFVVGLPRTGTTFLYKLLNQDPRNRAPLTWELRWPEAHLAGQAQVRRRIRQTQRGVDLLYRMCPGLDAMHFSSATTPEEDFSIFRLELCSTYFTVFFHVPSYNEWVVDQTKHQSFGIHRRVLETLSRPSTPARALGERWLLKSPEYLRRLPALFETYPDARIIHCHRSPAHVCGSEASLISMVQGMASDVVDVAAKRRQLQAVFADMLSEGMRARRALPNGRECAFDLRYADLVADPMAAVERIYDHFGDPLSDEARRRMQAFLARNPKDRRGKHQYEVPQLTDLRDEEARVFSEYCDEVGIPL